MFFQFIFQHALSFFVARNDAFADMCIQCEWCKRRVNQRKDMQVRFSNGVESNHKQQQQHSLREKKKHTRK